MTFLFVTFYTISQLAFTSCDNNEDNFNYNLDIIGTWQTEFELECIQQITIMGLNKDLSGFSNTYPKVEPNNDMSTFTYNINEGKIKITYSAYDPSASLVLNFSYHVSGDVLTLMHMDGQTFVHTRL